MIKGFISKLFPKKKNQLTPVDNTTPIVVDLNNYKHVREACLEMMLDRWAIEELPDGFVKASALSIWWRRFNILAETHPEAFPKQDKKQSGKILNFND